MLVLHERQQHAVGQGAFHSASVEVEGTIFRYVYDCGSASPTVVEERVRRYQEDVDAVDVLFLSHLDQDHVSGVDALLSRTGVGTVVLPYLTPFERLVLVAEAAARPSGASAVSELARLDSPARWFRERGADRVLFVLPTPSGLPPDGTPRPRAPQGSEDWTTDRLNVVLPPLLRVPTGAKWTDRGGGGRLQVGGGDLAAIDAPVVGAMDAGPILVRAGATRLWELIPFVHPEPASLPRFQIEVASWLRYRKPLDPDDPAWFGRLKSAIRTRVGRSELARLYNEFVRRDRNLTSLLLLSRPSPSPRLKTLGATVTAGRRAWRFPPFGPEPTGIGWLGTGDAHLDRPNRLAAFEAFYSRAAGSDWKRTTRTVLLPHHGSRRNLRPEFIRDRPQVLWVAAYGSRNSYGHPGAALLSLAHQTGAVARVTERQATELVETASLEM